MLRRNFLRLAAASGVFPWASATHAATAPRKQVLPAWPDNYYGSECPQCHHAMKIVNVEVTYEGGEPEWAFVWNPHTRTYPPRIVTPQTARTWTLKPCGCRFSLPTAKREVAAIFPYRCPICGHYADEASARFVRRNGELVNKACGCKTNGAVHVDLAHHLGQEYSSFS